MTRGFCLAGELCVDPCLNVSVHVPAETEKDQDTFLIILYILTIILSFSSTLFFLPESFLLALNTAELSLFRHGKSNPAGFIYLLK